VAYVLFFLDAFRKTIAAFGGLDIVVNNAGVFNDRFWEFEVDVNLVIRQYGTP